MEVYAAQVDRMDQGIGRILASLRDTGVEDDTLVMFLADNGGVRRRIGRKERQRPKSTREGLPVRVGNDPSVMPGPDGTFQSYGKPWANASNTPFRLYKHWVHEGGISTPFIARWPRRIQKHNRLTHQVGHLIDVMATCRGRRRRAGIQILMKATGFCHWNAARACRPSSRPSSGKIMRSCSGKHEGNRAIRGKASWKLVSRYPGHLGTV